MAVYTEVSDYELERFLLDYNIGHAVSFKGIAEGVENSNFFLLTDKGSYILTLYEKRVASEDLPYFLSLIEHLAKQRIACPTPIHGTDGNVLRNLCKRPAAITSFLSGVSPVKPTLSHCKQLGAALAQMHVAGQDYKLNRDNALSVDGWQTLFMDCKNNANKVTSGLKEELTKEIGIVSGAWPTLLPRGVIHADLFPDNVFFEGNKLSSLIDFYFACNDILAYDLAICLNAWCFDEGTIFNIQKAKVLIESYQNIRPFTDEEIYALPLLARGAALRFLLTRLYDWLNQIDGAMVKPKDPIEFLKRLQFHQKVKDSRAYGIVL